MARDITTLSSLGVTHILNAAAGRHRINTGPQFYSDLEVKYLGVEAADHSAFNLRPFFNPAAQFIDSALKQNGQCANKQIHNVKSNINALLKGQKLHKHLKYKSKKSKQLQY